MTMPPSINGESAAFIRNTNAVLRRLFGTDEWHQAAHRANLVCEFMPGYIRQERLERIKRRANREGYSLESYLANLETDIRFATDHYFFYRRVVHRYIDELNKPTSED